MEAINNQHIVNVDLDREMKKAYIDYAMSVIVSRALPDVRDGMKPVHRRILYDMYESNLLYENDFKKSAATVGDVLGKYHPHGDASVYDAMVRMAQDFSLRYPLVQGKGNFGSVDGDPPAAYRYTEAKMSKISALMLTDIEKETVDFVPNYDDKIPEPDVLPSRFPNLLVNGSAGIAVGMATNIPPHNLTEVIDGIIAVIDDPMITIEELMTHIQGPDFPTGGVIMGKSGIRNAYTTGRGRIVLRAEAEIEEHNGRNRIIVTEIPYQVNKAKLEKHINELVRDGKIDGIASTRDESTEVIRLVIDLKRDANPNVVLNNLYKFTQMQDTFGVILLALVDKQPKILNLREMIDYYIAHQEDVITRRTQFELDKALARAHILEGYKVVIDNVDEVIRIIRASKSIQDSKDALCARFGLSDEQADAIVKMQLGRLSGMEREKIEEEYQEVTAKIANYREILANEGMVLDIIKTDLTDIKNKYGDERRTKISMISTEIDIDDLIDEEDIVVTLTHAGYTKRVPADTYRSQNRGGRGISGMSTKEEDFVEHIFTTTTHHTLLFFTTRGVVYKLRGYQIPEASRQAKGTAIVNLLPLESDEKITAMIPIKEFEDGNYLTFVTKNGIIKKTNLMDYSRIRNGGLRAISLDEGDELIRVHLTDGTKDVILSTHDGYAIRFNESEVRHTGRTTRGVKGITLRQGDYIIGFSLVKEGSQLLAVTENGYGKKTALDEYRKQSRGGKGIFTYKITEKTGKLAGMRAVTDEDDIILITSEGVIIRMHTEDISTYSRQTQGVKLMRLDDGVSVASIARAPRDDEEEENTEAPAQGAEATEGENE
ncbi:MAG: DNA gyrase subunit A [Clostridia bacterium]|nr:DNA gyrase subunit A [Clostridia bacterium]MBQ9599918.1 DNA gyrase subunit A [Clostridia bacterium]